MWLTENIIIKNLNLNISFYGDSNYYIFYLKISIE